MPRFISRSRRTRSSIGGCVEKSDSIFAADPAERVHDEQVRGGRPAVLVGAGLVPALEREQRLGERLGVADERRARGVGAVLARARDRDLDDEGDERREERPGDGGDGVAALVVVAPAASPRIAPHWIAWPSAAMSPATAAAMVAMRMSRFCTWESSCASTPSSWRRSRSCRMPSVTATAACDGFRPVAKAFGVSDGMT